MLTPERIGATALRAILIELAVTPKPGLVDRNNSGAHRDMDFLTFQSSAAALSVHFINFAKIGYDFIGEPAELFPVLRKAGILAEQDMFRQTKGINTHKGAIFSVGLVCAAAGFLAKARRQHTILHEEICGFIGEMTEGLCKRELVPLKYGQSLTHGQKVYLQYQVSGPRGEAESGFAGIRASVYPVLSGLLKSGVCPLNDALAHVLLLIMANIVDTNVLYRHNMDMGNYVRRCARSVLEIGGCLNEKGIAAAKAMDADFIRKDISPGGCADLLAVCYCLYCLENDVPNDKGESI